MTLTADQKQAIDNGQAVPVDVDGRDCVVLRREIYDRVQRVLDYDSDDYSPRETYAAVLKAWDQDDENPEQYLEYLRDE